MNYMKYNRALVMLEEQNGSFCAREGSVRGYLKVETGNGKGALRCTVQNLRYYPRGEYVYKLILFGKKGERILHAIVGNLVVNRFGNSETYFRFNPVDVDDRGSSYSDYFTAIVAAVSTRDSTEALHPVLKGLLENGEARGETGSRSAAEASVKAASAEEDKTRINRGDRPLSPEVLQPAEDRRLETPEALDKALEWKSEALEAAPESGLMEASEAAPESDALAASETTPESKPLKAPEVSSESKFEAPKADSKTEATPEFEAPKAALKSKSEASEAAPESGLMEASEEAPKAALKSKSEASEAASEAVLELGLLAASETTPEPKPLKAPKAALKPETASEASKAQKKPEAAASFQETEEPHNYNGFYNEYLLNVCGYTCKVADYYEEVHPFESDRTGARWKKVVNVSNLPLVSPGAHHFAAQYRHYLFGAKAGRDGKAERFYFGIPGRFLETEQPDGGRSGFTFWQPMRGADREKTSYGYWIVSVDGKTGNIEDV